MGELKCTVKDANDWILFAEKFDDGEHEEDYIWRFAKDWLAMYDLLKNYVDEFPVRNSEIVWCVYASQMRDKIRALIGGE